MAAKGSTTARGYGTAHQKLRKRWSVLVAAGGVRCVRCGLPILPGTYWDLDHSPDRKRYLGPSHRYCNRRAGGRRRKTKIIKTRTKIDKAVSRW